MKGVANWKICRALDFFSFLKLIGKIKDKKHKKGWKKVQSFSTSLKPVCRVHLQLLNSLVSLQAVPGVKWQTGGGGRSEFSAAPFWTQLKQSHMGKNNSEKKRQIKPFLSSLSVSSMSERRQKRVDIFLSPPVTSLSFTLTVFESPKRVTVASFRKTVETSSFCHFAFGSGYRF